MGYANPIDKKKYEKKFQSVKITCQCGKIINRSSMPYHKKTELHILKVEKLNNLF